MPVIDVADDVTELKRVVRGNLERGVVGTDEDLDALESRLAACRTVREVEAFLRMARRWEYATGPVPEWKDWRLELIATRN